MSSQEINGEMQGIHFEYHILEKDRNILNLFRVVCYLTGILLAFLVLIGVIVVLTLMVANTEFGLIKQVDF